MSFAPTLTSSSYCPLQALVDGTHPECSPSHSHNKSGAHDIKPFSLPSLASITANLATTAPSTEQSYTGPHRKSSSLSFTGRRRFSPLGNSHEYADPVSPLESEFSGEGRSSASGISMIFSSGHRPRSHSLLSGNSVVGSFQESDAPVDESASDSGGSEKKIEDNDPSAMSKKRSRTLTTPSQQRRLMQILEQTRFPSTDLREQLARELGMTPRRVQIWFQNRRQGMKKALEQKTEQETPSSAGPDYTRSRGYSFGAYPPQADAYGRSGFQPTPDGKFSPVGMHSRNAGSGELHRTSQSIDGLQQLYSSRSVSREIPRGMAHLELPTNSFLTPNKDAGGAPTGDFIWSDPPTGGSLYSLPSAACGDTSISPFAKPDHYHSDSTHHGEAPIEESRHRSQTNPDFFGIINGLIELPGLGRTSQESLNPFQQVSDGTGQQMDMTARDQTISINDGWNNSYIQSAPAWQQGLDNMKLDRHNYNLDHSIHSLDIASDPIYGNSGCKVTDQSNDFYYSGGLQDETHRDSLDSAPLHMDNQGKYMSNLHNDSLEVDLAQHLRNRSHSLHF
ncbi:hypothetical protein MJO29_007726 [Puccinia striiformis f. sp. tritici]|uniref:Homeobox domain-containing protein n=1 Tax=Puccinia striiformis f. sp. tritici PST-78 TaxID=1165861 RepID=A0A0L0V718_9BASI|nr:hypothetical protein Pst134EA_013901 [Puccinia striiformis f. sp. tritici]KAH9466054.1 hypothetical protein Pst134EA_013901 [Puccinia striiformis f. sp. tritici]KAI7956327.1 hypothetical protein MJO29_007726 [Puccinia striiformis f. sp. tritici]KNE95067.1 hypothetical protein PSTG_11547 [Puccinia striiformis f. sp. tritici PST-78]KNE95068.1 hypothetical protein, variant [Puccinia striiformis f. sp. tritici PST-78]